MSVIVKGENLKKGCCGCHFRTGDFCGILEHNDKVKEYAERYKRSPHCPLIDIPEDMEEEIMRMIQSKKWK